MSKLTKEQWAKIERELSSIYEIVKLRIDGYEITLALRRIGQMQLAIMVFVNGQIDKSRLSEGTEIQRRFLCPHKKYVYSAKYRKSFKRMRKSLRESLGHDANSTWTYYWPWWTSFKAMKAHFIKNNQSIELIENEPLTQEAPPSPQPLPEGEGRADKEISMGQG